MWNLFKKVASPSIQNALPTHSSFASRDKQLHQLVDKYFNPNELTDSSQNIKFSSHSHSPQKPTPYVSEDEVSDEEEKEGDDEDEDEDDDEDDCITFKMQNERFVIIIIIYLLCFK